MVQGVCVGEAGKEGNAGTFCPYCKIYIELQKKKWVILGWYFQDKEDNFDFKLNNGEREEESDIEAQNALLLRRASIQCKCFI